MPTDYTVLPMELHFKQRRGTTEKINAYAGELGELLVDTTKNTVVLPSGTAGVNYPLAREDRTITSGAGINLKVGGSVVSSATLAQNFVIESNVSDLIAPDNLLKVDDNGKIAADFSLGYDNATGVFTVYGSDGTTSLATVTVPSHLSLLQSATLETASVESPVDGQTSGTFIHFVFNLSDGTTSDVYTDVTRLIDIYTAGQGLQLTNNVFSAKVGAGLTIDPSGNIALKIAEGENILKTDGQGNIYIDTTALTAATDQVIVSADSGNVVRAGTDGGALLKIAASANALTVNDSNELIVPLDMGVL